MASGNASVTSSVSNGDIITSRLALPELDALKYNKTLNTARRLAAPLFAPFDHIQPHSTTLPVIMGVVSDHRCVLPYKYRKRLNMFKN